MPVVFPFPRGPRTKLNSLFLDSIFSGVNHNLITPIKYGIAGTILTGYKPHGQRRTFYRVVLAGRQNHFPTIPALIIIHYLRIVKGVSVKTMPPGTWAGFSFPGKLSPMQNLSKVTKSLQLSGIPAPVTFHFAFSGPSFGDLESSIYILARKNFACSKELSCLKNPSL